MEAMNPKTLLLRCYAREETDGQWSDVCLDLCLAAQGDSFEEARKKLEEQIAEYVYDAVAGEDREYAADLLSRKAPLSQWLEYYWYKLINRLTHRKDGPHKPFDETLPLIPAA